MCLTLVETILLYIVLVERFLALLYIVLQDAFVICMIIHTQLFLLIKSSNRKSICR